MNPTLAHVIVVDDERSVLDALTEMLSLEGFEVHAFLDAFEALKHMDRWPAAVWLCDVKMPRINGHDLLATVLSRQAESLVLLMSGHGDIPMAIEAIKLGAYDFLEKPLSPTVLIRQLRKALEKSNLRLENKQLKQQLQGDAIERFIVGHSVAMQTVREQVLRLADVAVDTIIYGETGTGKEVVARALHRYSDRRDKAFVAINCGGMASSIIESELFGHEAGAFTGANKRRIGKVEQADGGTLFLDEVESMPVDVQIKLLRVLQERSLERLGGQGSIAVSFTVVAASKADLMQLSLAGGFRSDLYYRLNIASLQLPPLRDRIEDVIPLFDFFVKQIQVRRGSEAVTLSGQQIQRLHQHSWPGNVRELKNAASRVALGISQDDLGLEGWREQGASDFEDQMLRHERQILVEALRQCAGQLNDTAALLDLPRKTLYRKMKKHQLEKHAYRQDKTVP